MKIVDLKCPSCGGKLIPMEGNPKIVVCEYCNSQFMLEEDQTVNYHIHQYGPGTQIPGTQMPGTGTGIRPAPPSKPAETKKGNSNLGAAFISGAVILIFAALVTFVRASVSDGQKETKITQAADYSGSDGAEIHGADSGIENPAKTSAERSLLWNAMVEEMFGKSPDLVTEEELASVKYISIREGADSAVVEYSFSDPYAGRELSLESGMESMAESGLVPGADSDPDGNAGYETVSVTLPPLKWDADDLSAFTGLRKLKITNRWPGAGTFRQLENLQGISCQRTELSDIAQYVQPERLIELRVEDIGSLEGIAAFENLEMLTVEDIWQPDIKQLVALKNLRSLSLTESSSAPGTVSIPGQENGFLTDYSPLSVLTGLKELSLESEFLRDFSFLKALSGLESLTLEETEGISLEPLSSLTQLKTLKLADNDDLLDYEPLRELHGLKSLSLDKMTSQPDPDLSSLSQLETMEISGFISISFLRNMGNLKNLSIHGCSVDEIDALSALTDLESLTCYSVWTYSVPLRNVGFLDGMTGLKYLDFSGKGTDDFMGGYGWNMEILGDISNVFNHPSLEEVYLNNCMFEIDFDAVKENEVLKILEMKEIGLKENFYVQSSSGMTDIWYDDVTFDSHTDFLTNFPNLEYLELDGNQLTNIEFVSSLKHLAHLGINNNYVTDLTPLNQAESLKYLDIRQNPVSGAVAAGDDVEVVR